METLIGLVVAAPLLGAAVLLTGGRRLDRAGHLLGTLLALLSFVFGVVLFTDMLGKDSDARALHSHLFTWVPVGGFRADVGFQLDQLSMTFVLLITGVGTLIHIYSIGYMKEDERRRRFFGYLNLFLAAMLLLVLADNYLLLYAGWEGWASPRTCSSASGSTSRARRRRRRRRSWSTGWVTSGFRWPSC